MPANPTLHVHDSAAHRDAPAAAALSVEAERRQAGPAVQVAPLLVGAAEAGRLCGRSEASWRRDRAARRVPAPIKLGGRTLWRTQELREWVASGCPDRRTWEALQRNNRK